MTDQESFSYVKEIQSMMYGFGDVQEPLLTSAQLIEEILEYQIKVLWNQVSEIADSHDSEQVDLEHFLFLLRQDSLQIQRFLRYLKQKDLNLQIHSMTSNEPSSRSSLNVAAKRRKLCIEYLQYLDDSFHEDEDFYDPIDNQRKLRADLNSRNIDIKRYKEFVKARQISFGHGKYFKTVNPKFRRWLSKCQLPDTMSHDVVDTLAYLAYEIVAEIIDVALIVKQDASNGLLNRENFNMNSMTCTRNLTNNKGNNAIDQQKSEQIEFKAPITPEEIKEAIRRSTCPHLPGQLMERSAPTPPFLLL